MPVSADLVVVVGAGPYGLAAAAHLRSVGIDAHVFGTPMEFWDRHMPIGMRLRSSWDASHISDPNRDLTLDRYEEALGLRFSRPLPLANFVEYGRWFQGNAVPNVDDRRVDQIDAIDDGYRVRLADGTEISTSTVIVAAGIASFANRPATFAEIPHQLAPHSSLVRDVDGFAHRRVAVVGSGQSAVETAALLSETDADVEMLIRGPGIRWLTRSGWLHNNLQPIRGLLYHPTDVGPPVLNQFTARPDLFRRFPRGLQRRLAYRAIRPAATDWLRSRITRVRVNSRKSIVGARVRGDAVIVRLDDGTVRVFDRVVLATGYRIDVTRYGFLSRDLVASLRLVNGYPVLTEGFESSIPGLHFLGAPAADSYGPLMRFVSGTTYSATRLTRCVLGRSGRRLSQPVELPSHSHLASGT
jgi:glycine/D-amino acid oxidase-like deaminating enzyme